METIRILQATLVFPIDEQRKTIWLPKGKTGYSYRKLNGYGGKKEATDRTIQECAIREFIQESGAFAREEDLQYCGCVVFHWENQVLKFHAKDVKSIKVHVFRLNKWRGELVATKAMTKAEPFPLDNLPYDKMHEGQECWMQYLAKGKMFTGEVWYDKNGKVVRHNVRSMTTL